jgi:hypothetical protein
MNEEEARGRTATTGDSRTELVHAILILSTGLVLSTSALWTKTTLAFFNLSGLAKSKILSSVGASDDVDPNSGNSPGSIPARVSGGANAITLSTRSIIPEDGSPTLRTRWITRIDLLIASRIGSSFVVAPPSPFVVFVPSHPSPLPPMRVGRLAVATSFQSPSSIVRASSDDVEGAEAAASDSNRTNSSRNFLASAGDVTRTPPPPADLDEREEETATRRSRAAARPPSSATTAAAASYGVGADESDDDDDDDGAGGRRRRGGGPVGRPQGTRNAARRCRPTRKKTDGGAATDDDDNDDHDHDHDVGGVARHDAEDRRTSDSSARREARKEEGAPRGRRAVDDVGMVLRLFLPFAFCYRLLHLPSDLRYDKNGVGTEHFIRRGRITMTGAERSLAW